VALSPERFAQFPNLAALLAYLRACVSTVIIDAARAQASTERVYRKLEVEDVATPEQVLMERIDRDALWRLAMALVTSEQERVVLVESFAYDLAPRNVLKRHPDLFVNLAAVYSARRNLVERFRRNQELRRLFEEFHA